MTMASASAEEARVSYRLFQSSSTLVRKRAQHRENSIVSKGRASAAENAMLRFVARVLIARQHDLCGTGGLCAVFFDCVSLAPHPRHTEPQRPQRVTPRWGHFFLGRAHLSSSG